MRIDTLPSEVLVNVFSYLTSKELATTSTVSKLFKDISNDDALWRFRTYEEFTQFYQTREEEKWKEVYKNFYLKYSAYQKKSSPSNVPSQLYGPIALGCEQKLVPLLEGSGLDINQIEVRERGFPMPLLHFAIEKAHSHIINVLLEKGADPNIRDPKELSFTPLHRAAIRGGEKGANASSYTQIVTALLEKGADPNVQDRLSHTPLSYAAQTGFVGAASALIEKNADLNARDQNNRTPLHDATRSGSIQLVKLLIEKGADLNVQDRQKCTALHYAAYKKFTEIMAILIERGADPKIRDDFYLIPSQVTYIARIGLVGMKVWQHKYSVATFMVGAAVLLAVFFKYNLEQHDNDEG